MRLSLIITLLAAASFAAWGQTPMPRMTSVDPQNGKTGDELVVSGENLQKSTVAKVYLTDGTHDFEVTVTSQKDTEIKFKIPEKASGRLALMVLTVGKDAKLIEQPVKVQIEQ